MSVDRISEMAEKQLGQAFVQFIYFEMWVTEALDLGGEAGSGQTVAYALFSFKQPAIFTNIYVFVQYTSASADASVAYKHSYLYLMFLYIAFVYNVGSVIC